MVKIAFTGSFDPPHIGHKYVVDTAKSLGFDVVVIVANNSEKTYSKSLSERVRQAEEFFIESQCIGSDAGNIGEAIKAQGCRVIIRGVRDTKDFEYEQEVSDFNLAVNGLQTVYIPCPPDLRGVSSTNIRNQNENTWRL